MAQLEVEAARDFNEISSPKRSFTQRSFTTLEAIKERVQQEAESPRILCGLSTSNGDSQSLELDT